MAERLKDYAISAVLIIAVVGEFWSWGWSDRAALTCGIGALGLVIALPRLRKDEDSARAFVGAIVALGLVVASAVIAVYVVHSWAWLGFAGLIFFGGLLSEAWDRHRARHPAEPDSDKDIEDKQHRMMDEQLQKSFPR